MGEMLTTKERRRRISYIKATATAALLATVFTPKFELPDLVVPFVSVAVAAPIEGDSVDFRREVTRVFH
jgi:hypothetical protein